MKNMRATLMLLGWTLAAPAGVAASVVPGPVRDPAVQQSAGTSQVQVTVLGMTRPWQAALLRRRLRKIDAVAEARVSLLQSRVVLIGKPREWIPPDRVRQKVRSLALELGALQIRAQGSLAQVDDTFRLHTGGPGAPPVPLRPASEALRAELARYAGGTAVLAGQWRFMPAPGYLEVERVDSPGASH